MYTVVLGHTSRVEFLLLLKYSSFYDFRSKFYL